MGFNVRALFLLIVFSTCSIAYADSLKFNDPLHTSSEVLAALYKQGKIKPSEVKVVVFEFNYKNSLWHIELAPIIEPCLDCYPASYFKNKKNLVLQKIPHG